LASLYSYISCIIYSSLIKNQTRITVIDIVLQPYEIKYPEAMIASTPAPPYYAVIFTSIRTDVDEGYEEMSIKMLELAQQQPGYLGVESARNETGITVSYWKDLQSIRQWKHQTDHLLAQQLGRQKWYEAYKTRICFVERDYGFEKL
jgi:heme-degrading monooxygenase HmoA